MGKTSPNRFLDAHPRGRSSLGNFSDPSAGTLPAHSPWKNFFPAELARFPALSLLHTFGSIAPSFLPQTQHQRRQLAGHGQAQHGRIDSLLHARLVIILKRSGLTDGGQSAADLKISFSRGWWLRFSPRIFTGWARRTTRPSTRRYSLLSRCTSPSPQ